MSRKDRRGWDNFEGWVDGTISEPLGTVVRVMGLGVRIQEEVHCCQACSGHRVHQRVRTTCMIGDGGWGHGSGICNTDGVWRATGMAEHISLAAHWARPAIVFTSTLENGTRRGGGGGYLTGDLIKTAKRKLQLHPCPNPRVGRAD